MILPSSHFAIIEGLGGPEVVVIMLIVLVLFGGKKLPEFARGLGKSIREFKKAAAGVEEELKRALEEEETASKPAAPALGYTPPPASLPSAPAVATPPNTVPSPAPNSPIVPPNPSGMPPVGSEHDDHNHHPDLPA
jgi:sec-independent protein translocase protein TatA